MNNFFYKMTTNLEQLNLNTYNNIATHFDKTRTYIWKPVLNFINSLHPNSKYLEVGCGNGKNMKVRNDLESYGCDYSLSFVNICKTKNLNVEHTDCRQLPYIDNEFDAVISVAVLHHLTNDIDKAINEMIRVCKVDGLIYIQVWSTDAIVDKYIKIDNKNNYIVKWDNKYDRYYHFFTKDDIMSYIDINLVFVNNIYMDNKNWCIVLQKK